MINYEDVGSEQCRYCGTNLPPDYISDSNLLMIYMKTNGDDLRGTGFKLTWTVVSGKIYIFSVFKNCSIVDDLMYGGISTVSSVLWLPGSIRVSVQGVESLWGDCRFIPADWGS